MRAFFESVWSSDAQERASANRYLATTLPGDFREVTYQAIAPLPSLRHAGVSSPRPDTKL
jgi:hypothetical protein